MMRDTTLAALREIHAAPEVAWWPPAPGWWIFALLLIVLLVWSGRQLLRYWRKRRLRRGIMAELDGYAAEYRAKPDPRRLAAAVNQVLKRVARRRFGTEAVAGLHGHAWARFLADRAPGNAAGYAWRAATLAPYLPRAELDADAYLAVARGWIEHHV